MNLVQPHERYADSYQAYVRELRDADEQAIPWVLGWEEDDFGSLVRRLCETSDESLLTDDMVPHSTYWLVDDESEVVGVTNLRHRLNPMLMEAGGHVGYGIRPSARRKGFGTFILAGSLVKMNELGVDRVLVCCDPDNIGSKRIIEKNGGVFESEGTHKDGSTVLRFWIGKR